MFHPKRGLRRRKNGAEIDFPAPVTSTATNCCHRLAKKWAQDSHQMLGDPNECRRNAARCAELAVTASTPQLKATFLELSMNWEDAFAQVDDEIEWVLESHDAASPFWKNLASPAF
jgi:hypothetical protein